MAKQTLTLNKEEFQATVAQLEQSTSFKSRTDLWRAVEATDWAKNLKPRPLTAQVAMLRAKEMGLAVLTPLGKKGAPAGVSRKQSGLTLSRRMPLQMVSSDEQKMRHVAGRHSHLVDKVKRGNIRSAVKLHCITCSGGSKVEVRNCPITHCALYCFRPYQKDSVLVSSSSDTEESGNMDSPIDSPA